jgi:hypothetical protein
MTWRSAIPVKNYFTYALRNDLFIFFRTAGIACQRCEAGSPVSGGEQQKTGRPFKACPFKADRLPPKD